MNVNVRPFATSISSHMSANSHQEMLFPKVGYLRIVKDGPLIKLAWVYISSDLKHDFHQVT